MVGGRGVGEPPRSRRTAAQARREGDAKLREGQGEYSRRIRGPAERRERAVERVESDTGKGGRMESWLPRRRSSREGGDGAG